MERLEMRRYLFVPTAVTAAIVTAQRLQITRYR